MAAAFHLTDETRISIGSTGHSVLFLYDLAKTFEIESRLLISLYDLFPWFVRRFRIS